jgi:hypothetical protein
MSHVKRITVSLLPACMLWLGSCVDPEATESAALHAISQLCSVPAQPLISFIDLDADLSQRFQAGTTYHLSVEGSAPAVCVTLSLGGTFTSGSRTRCTDTLFPDPYATQGTALFAVVSNGALVISGTATPTDTCGAPLSQYAKSFYFRSSATSGGDGPQ